MYVVTVKFLIKPEFLAQFLTAMHKQAHDSLTLEDACSQFDVCQSEQNENLIYLYEIYQSKADFDLHLASDHFISFAEKVASWVEDKQVETFFICK